jgi:membrane protein
MKYRYRRLLLQWSPGSFLITWLKAIRFPKYENISLYKLVRIFLRNLQRDQIVDRSHGVAFNFILAIFPAVIFLFTLIPYVTAYFPEVNDESIMQFLGDLMPASMYDVISSTVLDIISNQRGGLLTFGFLFSVYLSTNGMMALMRAFNACYKTSDKRGAVKMRLVATALTVNLAVVLFLAVILLVVGELVLDYVVTHFPENNALNIDGFTVYLILILRFVVIFIVFFLAVATIYYFGPAVHYNWKFFSIGSFIATFLCISISYGFSYYVTNFATYNKVYGSIGVLIALMIWVQLVTMILLFGYEINASIHHAIRMEALHNAKKYKLRNAFVASAKRVKKNT